MENEYKRRFFAKVDKCSDGCWRWVAAKTSSGYGNFIYEGKNVVAHRLSYVWRYGEYDTALDLDHLCRNRDCVNPEHLEPVTRRVNLLRGNTIVAAHAHKTHCPKGHPYDSENTYLDKGSRCCRECRKIYLRKYYRRNKK